MNNRGQNSTQFAKNTKIQCHPNTTGTISYIWFIAYV